MRTAAALRIVRIDLLRRKAHWLVNGTQLATRGDGRGSTATAHIVLSGGWAGGVADTPHAYLVPHARYGLRSRSTAQEFVFGESCCGATAQREASRCVIVVLRARSRLLPWRDLLGDPEDAQRVEPRDLPHVLLAPPAPQQLGDQVGKLRHVLEPDGHFGDTVEVGAEPHVVDAGDGADVLDVVRHLSERRLRSTRHPRFGRFGDAGGSGAGRTQRAGTTLHAVLVQ